MLNRSGFIAVIPLRVSARWQQFGGHGVLQYVVWRQCVIAVVGHWKHRDRKSIVVRALIWMDIDIPLDAATVNEPVVTRFQFDAVWIVWI